MLFLNISIFFFKLGQKQNKKSETTRAKSFQKLVESRLKTIKEGRMDASLKNVIIRETALPDPKFSLPRQTSELRRNILNNTVSHPLGPEWNSTQGFMNNIQQRTAVKKGSIPAPLSYEHMKDIDISERYTSAMKGFVKRKHFVFNEEDEKLSQEQEREKAAKERKEEKETAKNGGKKDETTPSEQILTGLKKSYDVVKEKRSQKRDEMDKAKWKAMDESLKKEKNMYYE